MWRDCVRCGFTLRDAEFPATFGGQTSAACHDCVAANPAVHRVAAIAADGIVRCRAIHALLNLGFTDLARHIAAGATEWPDLWRWPVTRLWWISLDADTIALLRMLLGGAPNSRPVPFAA